MSTTSNNIHSTNPGASTTQKVAGVAHDAIDGAAKKATSVEHQLREQAHKASEQVGDVQAAAKHQVEQTMQTVENFIRERPVAATGLAFAAGALAALILRR